MTITSSVSFSDPLLNFTVFCLQLQALVFYTASPMSCHYSQRSNECILLLNPEQIFCVRTVGSSVLVLDTYFAYGCVRFHLSLHLELLPGFPTVEKSCFYHGSHGDYVTSVFFPHIKASMQN